MPQRILCCGFIAETGFLIPPEDNGTSSRRLAARVDIERGRTAARIAVDATGSLGLTAVSMRYDMTSPCRSQSFLMNDANQQAIVVRHFYEVRHKK